MATVTKKEYLVKTHRNFKVVHQHLSLTHVDFKNKKLIGFTELQLISQVDDLEVLRLNCQQCLIHSIYLNNYMCDFTYSDPTQDILPATEKKGPQKLDTFSRAHYEVIKTTDSDLGNGELSIQIPDISDVRSAIREGKILRLNISYMIVNPVGGLYFAVNNHPTPPPVEEKSDFVDNFVPHLFTYGRSNSSRLWFPCVDSFSESCPWTIRVTVDEIFTVISSGELTDVESNPETGKKRFTFNLSIPTSAPNIGLVVGPFTPVIHPNMHEVVHFAFPAFKSLLLDTCGQTHRIFEYYEDLLNTRYPYSNYKLVFVDNLDSAYVSYATMSVFNINLLHSKHVIEQAYVTRKALASAIAEQYFGCFISMQSTADAWLTRGIAGFLAHDYFKKAFGNNEYRYKVKCAMNKVIQYEKNFRPIVLDPSTKSYSESNYFHIKNFHTYSPIYDKLHRTKSFLIMRMLENYLGRELLLQVFNKMLSLAQIAAPQKTNHAIWFHLHASTSSFIWAISTVTGKNIETFLKQWVFQGGHVKLTGSFVFHHKRNTVELEIKQEHTSQNGVWRYLGPIMVWLQELDGTFKHTLQIEDNISKHDLTCHSKSRKNKKKKIPLCTGEEIDMDLSGMDPQSPVLWLRFDPEMNLLREVILEQPDYQWQYQLRYERDIIAQIESLEILDNFHMNQGSKNALMDIINNEQTFYRVRCEATFCLRKVANKMGSSWAGPPAMLTTFRKMFGSPSCPQIVRMNSFTNLQLYFLQKSMFVSMAGLRTVHGICPHEVLRFLLDLFKYNDNSKNKYTDAYLKAALIDAIAETVTPVPITASVSSGTDLLSQDTKNILEEIVRYFNFDKLLPSYKHVITCSCLRAIRHLQKMGHLPSNTSIFRHHTWSDCFLEVRKVAIIILVDVVKAEGRKEDLDFLLDLLVTDPSPVVKYYILKQLIRNPPFSYSSEETNRLDTEELAEKLWNLMNNQFACQSKLRCATVDLYYVLYGRGRPRCLPKTEFSFVLNLKEKKPLNSTTENEEEMKDANEAKIETELVNFDSTVDNEAKNDDVFMEEVPATTTTTATTAEKVNEENLKIKISAESFSADKKEPEGLFGEKEPESAEPMATTGGEEKPVVDEPQTVHDSGDDEGIRLPNYIPPISIRMKSTSSADGIETEYGISSNPLKKRKEDHKGEERVKKEHKEKHHKDKKKKKKKHKNKHKHKHKHHSNDPEA